MATSNFTRQIFDFKSLEYLACFLHYKDYNPKVKYKMELASVKRNKKTLKFTEIKKSFGSRLADPQPAGRIIYIWADYKDEPKTGSKPVLGD